MITKDLHPLIAYLQQHRHVGELFTFFVAFIESLPIIGTIVPGTITMTAVGFLMGTGALPILIGLFIASIAAFCGDAIGFAIGFWYNDRLRNIWPFKKYPKWLALGEAFVRQHGGKSIIIGRFVGPVRSTVPLIAGLLRLTWVRFFTAAIFSAICWAIVYTLPGTVLGALSREIPHGEMTKFLLYGIGFFAIIWLIFWLIQHFFLQLARAINQFTNRLWDWLSTHKSSHWFIRLITNREDPADHRPLTLFVFAALSAILFLILLINVRCHTILTAWNKPVFHLLQSIHTKILTKSLIIITIMGTPKTMMMTGVLLTLGFLCAKQWRAAAHIFAALILSAGAVVVFKSLSHSLRPQGFYIVAKSSSFPSGHTTLSFVITGFFAFLVASILPKAKRWIPYTLSTLFVILVAFSRVYLGAHWLTDIIGSCLLATTIVFVCIISFRCLPWLTNFKALKPTGLSLIILLGFGVSWGIQIPRMWKHDQKRYTRVFPKVTITQNNWWQSTLKYTPVYRNNRFGQPFQPFNLQWAGNINVIHSLLEKAHWVSINHHSYWKDTLKRFATYDAASHMPILPWLYRKQPARLVMIKHMQNRKAILELRLWKSGVTIKNTHQPLWLGTIDTRLAPTKLLSLKHRAKVKIEEHLSFHQLTQDTAHLRHKLIVAPKGMRTKKHNHWSGNILLIT